MRWHLVFIFLVLLLQGCVQPKLEEAPVAKPALPEKVLPKKVQLKPVAPEVVVLVSDDIPAYNNVAKALVKQLGRRGSIRYLKGSRIENIKILTKYKNDKHKQFVSIGLKASVAAKSLVNRQVVFCQVFNYQDYGLLSARHKGVSMMPSASRIFRTWRALSPNITDIGIISGPGFDDMMQLAKAAARNLGITLHYKSVKSDKEYQFAYKQMASKVQGYWVLPDNRVLSGAILRDVMTFSVRNSKQVAVFNKELLSLGGLFTTISDNRDVVLKVLSRLKRAQNKKTIPGLGIIYPNNLELSINPVMAKRLNLKIPNKYKKYINAI